MAMEDAEQIESLSSDTTALTQQLVLMQFLDLLGLQRDRRIAPTEAVICRNLGDFRLKGSGNY
jgi:hypothetical protein